jgi:hypothetical protein
MDAWIAVQMAQSGYGNYAGGAVGGGTRNYYGTPTFQQPTGMYYPPYQSVGPTSSGSRHSIGVSGSFNRVR